MVPDFDIKTIDTKLSGDRLAHLCLYIMVVTTTVYYLFTNVFHHHFHASSLIGFGIIVFIVLLEAISRFVPPTKNWEVFNSGGAGPLIVYNLATAVLVIAYVPLFSPFIFSIAAVMFITIYYRGLWAFIYSVCVITAITIIYVVVHGLPHGSVVEFYPLLFVILGSAFGGVVARAGAIDSALRKEFVRISKSIEVDREQLSSLMNNMPAAVIAIDMTGKILFYNAKATNYLVIDGDGVSSPSLVIMRNKRGVAVNLTSLADDYKTDKLQLKDTYVYTSDEGTVYLGVDISPILTKQHKQEAGFIIILRDITKDKSLDEERDEFISVTYHELRTPLASAEGSLSILLNPEITVNITDHVRQQVQTTYDSITYLSNVTNQLAMLAQAEASNLKITYEELDAVILIKKLEYEFIDQAEKKNLQLVILTEHNTGIVRTSKTFVEEILKNLISNAIKFTEEGTVTIKVSRIVGDDSITFTVTDTGVGISTRDKDNVFSKYYRAEDYRTRKNGGTGLGLYLSSKLANYIGANMEFDSELNRGSTFILRVPNISESSSINNKTS